MYGCDAENSLILDPVAVTAWEYPLAQSVTILFIEFRELGLGQCRIGDSSGLQQNPRLLAAFRDGYASGVEVGQLNFGVDVSFFGGVPQQLYGFRVLLRGATRS